MQRILWLSIILLLLLSSAALAQVSRPGIGYDDSWPTHSNAYKNTPGVGTPRAYDYNDVTRSESEHQQWKSLGLQDRYEPPPAIIPPKRSAEDLNPNGVTIYDNKGRMTNCMSNFDGSYYCYSTGGRSGD